MDRETIDTVIQLTKELVTGKSIYINGELSQLSAATSLEAKKKIIDNCISSANEMIARITQLDAIH